MYSGYELCEGAAVREGSEEYLDSEKYQLRPRDWSSPASIAPFITRLNEIRNGHRDAIAQLSTLRLHHMTDDWMLCVSRSTPDKDDVIIAHRQPGSASSTRGQHVAGPRRARRGRRPAV